VLGGLYGGFFNPTEAGAAGAFRRAGHRAAAQVARLERTFWNLLVETGQITVSVLFLILAATFFSRMLALSGVPRELAEFFLSGPIGPYGFLLVYLVLIIALGCLIDSISIMLILLPIALPVAEAAGFDLIWFGVLTVVAVEVGTSDTALRAFGLYDQVGDGRPRPEGRRDLSRRAALRRRDARSRCPDHSFPADRDLARATLDNQTGFDS
jgi:TRAP-type mannitol/chloroaromatic compound transport system permease large subunit